MTRKNFQGSKGSIWRPGCQEGGGWARRAEDSWGGKDGVLARAGTGLATPSGGEQRAGTTALGSEPKSQRQGHMSTKRKRGRLAAPLSHPTWPPIISGLRQGSWVGLPPPHPPLPTPALVPSGELPTANQILLPRLTGFSASSLTGTRCLLGFGKVPWQASANTSLRPCLSPFPCTNPSSLWPGWASRGPLSVHSADTGMASNTFP